MLLWIEMKVSKEQQYEKNISKAPYYAKCSFSLFLFAENIFKRIIIILNWKVQVPLLAC